MFSVWDFIILIGLKLKFLYANFIRVKFRLISILQHYLYKDNRCILTFTCNAECSTINSFPTNVTTSLVSNSYWFGPTM